MSGLTDKQQEFAAGVAKGMTQAAAYRQAYPKSMRWKENTVWQEASRLANSPQVRARVAELQEQTAERALVSLVDHVGQLARLRGLAEKEGQLSAAVKAEELRGKVCGLYTEKVEHTGPGGGPLQHVTLTPAEFRAIAVEVARTT